MTTVGTILDAALAKFLVFDEGRSDIGNDDTELFGVLNRRLRTFYMEAAMPARDKERERDDFFATTTNLTLVAGSVTLPSFAWQPSFVNASGAPVRVTTKSALLRGRGELPPAVYIRQTTVYTAARAGDPGATDVLTAHYTPLPAVVTDRAHFIGATTATDSSTSQWPAELGDAWLIASLAHYLLLKSQDANPADLETLSNEALEAYRRLFGFVRGVH